MSAFTSLQSRDHQRCIALVPAIVR